MKKISILLGALTAIAGVAAAGTVTSYTGVLASPESTFTTTVNLLTPGTVTLQTWSFGGGTNAAGAVIPAGGFDPFVGIFSGTGPSAIIETSGGGSVTYGSSDILTNYSSFMGCPPAGVVTIGSVPGQCGDITMSLSLPVGTYTVLLSDALYYPNAVNDNGTLGEGFTDLTGGSFPLQTCYDASDCNTDTPNWALDISTPNPTTVLPEPATLGIEALSLAIVWLLFRIKVVHQRGDRQ